MIALYIIIGIVALFLIAAAVTGTGWTFEKSIFIQAPGERVWPHVNSLNAMNTWNPWIGNDPNIRQSYTGIDGTPGATYAWDSKLKNVGAGKQTIISVAPGTEMASRVQFIRPFAGIGDGYVRLTAEQGGTRATWGIVSSTPYPMNIIKLFGIIEKNMDRDFGKGLNSLKEIAEK